MGLFDLYPIEMPEAPTLPEPSERAEPRVEKAVVGVYVLRGLQNLPEQ